MFPPVSNRVNCASDLKPSNRVIRGRLNYMSLLGCIALDSLQKEMILDSEVNADPFLTYPLLVMKVPWWMSST